MKCIIAGASGLVGNILLQELIKDSNFSEIIILVRKKIKIESKKVKQIIFNFQDIENYKKLEPTDIIFCCLGTTIKIAKSKENFKKVDFEYPLLLAKNVKTKNFTVISSMGANKKSLVFYSKVKGELEEELKKLNFASLNIFRPSQLSGERKVKRKAEVISEKIMKVFHFMIPKNFDLIKAETVAKAMNISAIKNNKGTFTFLSNDIKQIVINEKN